MGATGYEYDEHEFCALQQMLWRIQALQLRKPTPDSLR